MDSSLIVACNAGVPVYFLTTEEIALDLAPVAEELIVSGAQVDVITEPHHNLEVLSEVLDELEQPGIFAVCRRDDEFDAESVRAVFERDAVAKHRWLDVVVGGDVLRSVLQRVRSEVEDLHRVTQDAAQIERIDPDEVSDVTALPKRRVPVPVAEACEIDAAFASLSGEALRVSEVRESSEGPQPKRARSAIPWTYVVGGVAVGAIVIVTATSGSPETAPLPEDTMASNEPLDLASSSAPRPRGEPVPPTSEGRQLAPARQPVVLAQGPQEPPIAEVPDAATESPDVVDDPLAGALRRGEVFVHDGFYVTVVDAALSWRQAMTECRRRPFAGSWGWRIATMWELRSIGRTGRLPSTAWSSTRADRAGEEAFVVDATNKRSRANKNETTAAAVCVRPREQDRPQEP